MNIPADLIKDISSKMKNIFGFDMPSDVEWRTSDHPDYKKDKQESDVKDAEGFITRDWKKVYANTEMDKDFVAHEMGHFFDRHLGNGKYFSHTLDLPDVSNKPHENFAMMVSFMINDGHPGGDVQKKIYDAVMGKKGKNNRMARSVVSCFMNRLADYPDHPDDVVITKKESLSGDEILEIDVWNYYSGVKSVMVEELKGREMFIGMKLKGQTGKPLYIRHPYDKKTDYIHIDNEKDFDIYHSGRTVEFHITMPRMAPYYVVDFDAGDEPFSQTKEITAKIADGLDKLPEVKSVEIRFTGKRGFHVLGWLKKAKDVDEAREFLRGWLKDNFGDRDDVVIGESPSGKKGALGLSPMKVNGGQVALWSLRVTGLCCVEVPRPQLMSFEKEDASLEKTYKRLTGKSFKFNEKKSYDIPSSIHLEKPTASAVKALSSEHPVSSGWHSGFSKELNQLEPCWAIVFKGQLSSKALKAATESGLKVKERKGLTDVYLPDVSRSNYDKATGMFDKFADLYRGLTKRTASVINNYINIESIVVKTSSLIEYKKKRDPEKTPEPFDKGEGKNIFVIQKHKADRAGLHFDFRLQEGDALKSWAIKKHKLPSKGGKLLAVETEMHPLSYSDFEGTIPEGQYGAGDVEIYDKGTYTTIKKSGKVWKFKLNGKKEDGVYVLVHTGKSNWLLIKSEDR
jgi:DNA ligase D-like protein (predicted 3'-phosphoesterase)